MDFSRYVLKFSYSNMYLLAENKEALLIDPNPSEEAMSVFELNGIKKLYILLTHEHFDHITGVNWYKKKINTTVICQGRCAESIRIAKNNRPFVFFPMVEDKTEEEKREILEFYAALPVESIEADVIFDDSYIFAWKGHNIYIKSCPGHSMGSSIIFFDDTHVFTGDYMIPDAPVILRFPGGSKKEYKEKTLPYLRKIPAGSMIMPGHGLPYRKMI